jgi:arsenate reductase (thioredoxin)
MAEGYLRFFAGHLAEVFSAGIETHGVNPKAIEVMADDGIDISHHTSNHVDEYQSISFDFIITVCDHALEACPYFPSLAVRFHQNFKDPSKTKGKPEEIHHQFVMVRNQIRAYSSEFVATHLRK